MKDKFDTRVVNFTLYMLEGLKDCVQKQDFSSDEYDFFRISLDGCFGYFEKIEESVACNEETNDGMD